MIAARRDGRAMLGPFLTDLDSRAQIKGSRDPLGIQSIWTRFGRHVVGNLSTVSSSVRDFTILMLGYYLAQKISELDGPGQELETFLRWEQLAGYARAAVNEETNFRGMERVWRNLDEPFVILSAAPAHQILSSQKLYGIWGLYTVPGKASCLLEGEPVRLTPNAQEIVERCYLTSLGEEGFKEGKPLIETLRRARVRLDHRGSDRRLLQAVAKLIRWRFSSRERAFYREHLLYGSSPDSTEGRQRQLAELLGEYLDGPDFPWSVGTVRGLAKETASKGEAYDPLARRLARIAAAETVLAPASALFIYLLGCDGATVTEVCANLRRQWGNGVETVAIDELASLEAEMAGEDPGAGQRWLKIGQTMVGGNYTTLIRLLLEQNRMVMQLRGGAAAWAEEQNGRLRIRMTDERARLPQKSELADLWRFPYFLNSLYTVAFALKEDPHG